MGNLASGIPIGLGTGFVIGIAAGTKSGQQKARKDIKQKIFEYRDHHGLEISNRLGNEVAIEEFIHNIVGDFEAEETKANRSAILAILFSMLGLAALLLIYFLAR